MYNKEPMRYKYTIKIIYFTKGWGITSTNTYDDSYSSSLIITTINTMRDN